VELPGVDLNAFLAFLEYLYTDNYPIEGDPIAILVLADQYCVNRLKALCELHISKNIENTTEVSVTYSELDVIGKYSIIVS